MERTAEERTRVRPDANRIALRAMRAILDAAAPFALTVEGMPIDIQVGRLPSAPWPSRGLEGLDESEDGPLPRAVRAACTWTGGSTELLFSVAWWQTKGDYRHLVGIRTAIASTNQEIGWTTVALRLRDRRDGEIVKIPASFAPFKRQNEDAAHVLERLSYPLKEAVDRAGLPRVSPWNVEVFGVRLPEGAIDPSAQAGFQRLVHLALLKLPFFVRGEQSGIIGVPPFNVEGLKAGLALPEMASKDGASPDAPRADNRREAIWSLPGGVRQYKQTLDTLLAEFQERSLTEEAFLGVLRDRYNVTGATAGAGYTDVFLHLGLLHLREDRLELTAAGEAYLRELAPSSLFELLHRTYTGLLEILVIADVLERADAQRTRELLPTLIGSVWRTNAQVDRRRNWLLSLGVTERQNDGDVLTDLGRQILHDHASEVARIRARLDDLLVEQGPSVAGSDTSDDGEEAPEAPRNVVVVPRPTPLASVVAPSAWFDDTLDLTPERAAPFASELELHDGLLAQACAALSSGKHLLFVGPPGTGKTVLAKALARAAASDGYCAGAFVATASADWTTFDTVGGYALQKDNSLAFRPGVFIRAIERHQWLVIDELNRADVDRAFGELMTVLSGHAIDTALLRNDDVCVSIGPDESHTCRVPPTFRVIATMNTWDKTSLFRLSYAVQRRFAMIHVDIPDDATYARLLSAQAGREGVNPPLPDGALGPLTRLFSTEGLLAHRAIGPAVAIDMVHYMRRRQGAGDSLAEAMAMYLLPQLEGLSQEPASKVRKSLIASLAGWSSNESIVRLQRRYDELFPHLTFGEA